MEVQDRNLFPVLP